MWSAIHNTDERRPLDLRINKRARRTLNHRQ